MAKERPSIAGFLDKSNTDKQDKQDMKDRQAEQDKQAEQGTKKKTASFRIEEALLDRLREARWTLKRSQADIIEAALKEYLSRFDGV